MFCKWCGGNLTPSDTKCKRCGREVPARSDCGGFYDLVPDARNGGDTPRLKQQDGAAEYRRIMASAEKMVQWNVSKATKKLMIIMGAGFAVVLVLVLALFITIGSQSEKIEDLTAKLDRVANDVQEVEDVLPTQKEEPEQDAAGPGGMSGGNTPAPTTNTEAPTEDPTEEPTGEPTELPTRPNSDEGAFVAEDVRIKVLNQAGKWIMEPNEDVKLHSEGEQLIFDLADIQNAMSLEIKQEKSPYNYEVYLPLVVDPAVFGEKASLECEWEYRIDSDSGWISTDKEESFGKHNEENEVRLHIRQSDYEELLGGEKQTFELLAKIEWKNTDGGTLTIIIEGIRFYQPQDSVG